MINKTGVYMIRKNGEIIDCGDLGFHPYINGHADKLEIWEEFEDFFVNYPEQIYWIIKYASDSIKEKLKNLMQLVATYLYLCEKDDSLEKLFEYGTDSSVALDIISNFDIMPDTKEKEINGPIIYKKIIELYEEVNDEFNNEFLRLRMGGLLYQERDGSAYFRVSSNGFNWFNVIWKTVFDNKGVISDVTIVKDFQSGKTFRTDDYYIAKGKKINRMPTEEFLTLPGNPIVEDFGNDNESYQGIEISNLIKELGIPGNIEDAGDNVYTIQIRDSNSFGRINSIMDNSSKLEPIDESSYLTAENGNLDYKYDDKYLLSLIADFENDIYQLVITVME